MNNKAKILAEKIKQQAKTEDYWHRASPYVQPKIIKVCEEDMTIEKYMKSIASNELIEGGRQVPNRKPKY